MSTPVVVGVDDSPTAAAAAVQAAKLAQALQLPLHIVTAVERIRVGRIAEGSDVYEFSTENEAREIANDVANRVRSEYGQLNIEVSVYEGKPAEAIIETAEELQAELIVVGNKRVQGMARILGSIAVDVARGAPCDVYIAHTH